MAIYKEINKYVVYIFLYKKIVRYFLILILGRVFIYSENLVKIYLQTLI